MLCFGVEEAVGVVHKAEQDYDRLLCLFQEGLLLGKLRLGHLKLLWTGNSDGPRFTLQTTQHSSRENRIIRKDVDKAGSLR